ARVKQRAAVQPRLVDEVHDGVLVGQVGQVEEAITARERITREASDQLRLFVIRAEHAAGMVAAPYLWRPGDRHWLEARRSVNRRLRCIPGAPDEPSCALPSAPGGAVRAGRSPGP